MHIFFIIIGLPTTLFVAHTLYRAEQRRRHTIAAPGIDESGLISINGIRQYLHIRGKNLKNPVLLILHGGPGSPMTAMAHGFQYDWEDKYTVVEWDQRQAGKTYFANDVQAVADTLNFDTVLEDAWQVTQYIQKRLGVTKIALMGHSWGTVLGTALAQTHPEAFSCYIGVGQMSNLKDNERMGYEETLKRAGSEGNAKDVAALTLMKGYPGITFSEEFCKQMLTVRKYQQKYGIAETISLKNVILVMSSPYYNVSESMYYTKDTVGIHQSLFRYMFEEYNALNFGTDYQMPVYYIMGENDYQTPVPLARKLFEQIKAPDKKLFLIPKAGHFTMADNPQEFNKALLDEIRVKLQSKDYNNA